MRLGIDFDNTIVNYDSLFHSVAVAAGLVPHDLPHSKQHVRQHLRDSGKESDWTEMQGLVYGARIDEAVPYQGVIAFLTWARDAGHDVAIISHKTRWPFSGPRYDLHDAARGWILATLRDASGALVPPENVFFEETKKRKVERIASTGRDCFIDDLPEILLAPEFPGTVMRVLFDPDGHHQGIAPLITTVAAWDEIRAHVQEQCLSRI